MIDNLFHKYYDYIQEKENNYIDFTKRGGHILKCVLISLILVSIVANDFYNGKVSNWLILIGMILGIAVRMQEQGAYGMLVFVGGFVGTACCLFLFFLLKMFGAGDIKVLAVLGGWYGISFSITCFVYSIFIGGAVALLSMIRSKTVRIRVQSLYQYVTDCVVVGKVQAYPMEKAKESGGTIHFTLEILIGFLLTFHHGTMF